MTLIGSEDNMTANVSFFAMRKEKNSFRSFTSRKTESLINSLNVHRHDANKKWKSGGGDVE